MSTNQKLSRTHNAYTRLTFKMGKKNSHNIQCYVTGASSELHKILFYWVVKMSFMKCDTGIAKIEIHDYLLAMLFSTLEKVNFLFFSHYRYFNF